MINLKKEINLREIESLIPHRKPFLLIDKLIEIEPMISAIGVMSIKKSDFFFNGDRKSTRLNSSHSQQSRMPSSA